MKTLLALSSFVILLTACSDPIEMNSSEVFKLLTQEEGTIGGIMLGDSWAEAEGRIKNYNDLIVVEYHQVLGTFAIDYGHENRRFVINCNLKNDIIQSLDIKIVDLKKNKDKIIKLHDRLAKHYTEEYPDECTRYPGDFDSDFGKWRVMNGEESLKINSPTLIGLAPEATKCYNIDISLTKEL